MSETDFTNPAPDPQNPNGNAEPKDKRTTDSRAPSAKPASQAGGGGGTGEAGPQEPVEFDGPYDEDRAKSLIAKLRAENKAKGEKLSAFDRADKERRKAEMSELQKAQARAEEAEKALAEAKITALRAAVATEHEVPEALLTGATEDELTAQAKALTEWRKPTSPTTRPKAALVPGTGRSDDGSTVDPVAMADRIRGQY